MNLNDEFLNKKSEKELEQAYKEAKMMEVPDLWGDIEKNLTPKKKKKKIPVRRLATIAAVFLVVVILIPTLKQIREGSSKDGTGQYESTTETKMEDSLLESTSGSDANEDTESSVSEEEQSVLEVELEVLIAAPMPREDGGEKKSVSAKVLEDESGRWNQGDVLILDYDSTVFSETEVTGTLKVSVKITFVNEEKENLEIIEILP